MSYYSLRHPEEFERDYGSPFESQIPTRKGCIDCGDEMTELPNGDLVCLNCRADEEREAHTNKKYRSR